MLKRSAISACIRRGDLQISPLLDDLKSEPGNAAVDVHLGRWFLSLRHSNQSTLDLALPPAPSNGEENQPDDSWPTNRDLSDLQFVDFDNTFSLHPQRFVLGATLEWVKLSDRLAGTIVGKSYLGRHGLIIETAPVVHPGFLGCLTLELTNVGEVPINLHPGMEIAQLQLYRAIGKGDGTGRLMGNRRPSLGGRRTDPIVSRLRMKKPNTPP